eukprot:2210416-Pleurochrysis_carterae.AAC.7
MRLGPLPLCAGLALGLMLLAGHLLPERQAVVHLDTAAVRPVSGGSARSGEKKRDRRLARRERRELAIGVDSELGLRPKMHAAASQTSSGISSKLDGSLATALKQAVPGVFALN